MADTAVMIGTGLAAVLIVIAMVLIAVMIGRINAANIIGEVRQSDCGYGVLELDTLRYNVHEALSSDFNESVKGVALTFFIIALLCLIVIILIIDSTTYKLYCVSVLIGLVMVIIAFWVISTQSMSYILRAPALESYGDNLDKVSEYLGRLKGYKFDAKSGFAELKLGLFGQAQLNPEGTKVKNEFFNLPLYILQQKILNRIQDVDNKKSSLETEKALEDMDGADIFKYIAFETDADLLLETLAAYDAQGKKITIPGSYDEGKTKKLNNVINIIGLTVDNIKDYTASLNALKDTNYDKIRDEVNDKLTSLKWVMYISSAIILFAVYMFTIDKLLGGDSFWVKVAFGVIVCIHITLYSFIG